MQSREIVNGRVCLLDGRSLKGLSTLYTPGREINFFFLMATWLLNSSKW